jgi:hypothetical protein
VENLKRNAAEASEALWLKIFICSQILHNADFIYSTNVIKVNDGTKTVIKDAYGGLSL